MCQNILAHTKTLAQKIKIYHTRSHTLTDGEVYGKEKYTRPDYTHSQTGRYMVFIYDYMIVVSDLTREEDYRILQSYFEPYGA